MHFRWCYAEDFPPAIVPALKALHRDSLILVRDGSTFRTFNGDAGIVSGVAQTLCVGHTVDGEFVTERGE